MSAYLARKPELEALTSWRSAPALPGAIGLFALERQHKLLREAALARQANLLPVRPWRARAATALHRLAARLEAGLPQSARRLEGTP